MQNINIDNGFKTFSINNDPNKTISFDPSDINIISRINESGKDIDEKINDLKLDFELDEDGEPLESCENYSKIVKQMNDFIVEKIDYIFNSKVADVVFEGTSPLSTRGGVPYYERLIVAIKPIIEKEVQTERKASEKRIAKHTNKYTNKFANMV